MADESYWTYRGATPEAPPEGSKMALKDWHSLSPGMRREIARQTVKAAPTPEEQSAMLRSWNVPPTKR